MAKKNDELCINPMKDYNPPKYPTYEESRNNTTLLKDIPARWQNNAKIISCIGLGLISTIAITGCKTEPNDDDDPPYVEPERPHGGGAGGGGSAIYIPHLSEEDVLISWNMQLETDKFNKN